MATLHYGDCLEVMRGMEADSVDLVFCSPPYEAARTYGVDFKLRGEAWVEWAFARYVECLRVCRGLVAWVVEGQTRDFCYSATPILLAADLARAGHLLRKPPAFHRVGIPGSGGPDWLRNDYEFILCACKRGKLPWSDNTAMGTPPKWKPGGAPSHRMRSGRRVAKLHTKADAKGKRQQGYNPPSVANPGNIITCSVGGGRLGSLLSHENEAPFPESLVEFFVRSFCPPGGTVLDPFAGSGTTLAVAERHGRQGIGIDLRKSQILLSECWMQGLTVEQYRERLRDQEVGESLGSV